MGFMNVLGKSVEGGLSGGLQGGLSGAISGAVSNLMGGIFGGTPSQEELLEQQMKYQDRMMGMQAKYNKQMANYTQQLSREQMEWEIKNKARIMKEGGLNPALMYGKGGAGGSAAAGTAGSVGQPAMIDPTMAVQYRQAKANVQLTEAQAAKTMAETQKMQGVDTEGSELENEKKREEVNNLKQQGKLLLENITGAKEDNKLKEFQNWLNDAKKKMRTDDESFAEALAGTELREILARENIAWRDWRKAAIDDEFNARLSNFMDTLVEGEVAKATEQIERAEQAKNDTDFQIWTQRQEKALSDALDELLEGAGKYEKILIAIAKWIFRSDSGAWKTKGGKK